MTPTPPSRSTTPPDRGHLLTEQRNERSSAIDRCSVRGCLSIINDEDATIAGAVREQLDHIADFTELVIGALAAGGRLIYLGAGTSGRLGVLDASECPPTFQTDPDRVIGVIAGGDSALRKSSEHKEDDPNGAHAELDALHIGGNDCVLGIAAGGTTPYVLGGVEHAKSLGARTGLLTCTPIEKPGWCDVLVAVETGPEVVTGSTRMKAGTATKMVLNMITTTAMIRLGKVHGNLMVDLRATNDKLRDRAARILMMDLGIARDEAFDLLDRAHGLVKPAIVMHTLGIGFNEAQGALDKAGGRLAVVLDGA
ncbi:MAG: N-acetylmuramic acid 6-phosphate etherase [Phycisphaerales bacterium]|nr:N-acetylmuramic acid 6-phosphate etherase [Phycisphaerales bacterium]